MKIYMVECGTFHQEGNMEDYVFKTKKEAHEYMRETYNCWFTEHKPYGYYRNTKQELWYRLNEFQLKER